MKEAIMRTTYNIILFAAIAASIASCTKEYKPTDPAQAEAKVFTAYFADATTRAYLDSLNDLHWTKGDKISIFGSVTNERYAFDGMTGDNGGTFSKDGGSPVSPTWSKYYAIYPYNSATSASAEGEFVCTIPETQYYAPGTFDPDAALMVARTDNINATDIKFRHACAFLKVKVYSKTNAIIRKLILSGNSYECLSGTGDLTLDSNGIPSIELNAEFDNNISGSSEGYSNETGDWATKASIGGSNDSFPNGNTGRRRVILDCGEDGVRVGTTAETATVFVFALAPGTFTDGIKITTVDIVGGQYTKSTHKSVTLPRSSVSTMAAYELDMAGGGLEITSFSLTTPTSTVYTASNIGNSTINLLIPESVDKSALRATFTTTGKDVYIGSVKQESEVTVNDFTGTVTYTVRNVTGDSKDYTVNIQTAPKLIACWGDSFTHYGSVAYPSQLNKQLGSTWTVYDGGIAGDKSNEIAARQGAIKTIIRNEGGVDIPATTTNVSITTICTDDKILDPGTTFNPSRWTYDTRGLNNCIVGGVECKLAYNSLIRASAGNPVHIKDSTEIITYGAAHCKDADVIIIYMGTNGGWEVGKKNYNLLIAQHQAMIDFTTQKKYIILTSHVSNGFAFSGGTDPIYLQKMHNAFGDHVIYLRSEINARAEELLVKTGVYASKSEISDIDRQYIANGEWPLSFFCSESDEHPNRYGSTAMAILIKEKMIELGYLDD